MDFTCGVSRRGVSTSVPPVLEYDAHQSATTPDDRYYVRVLACVHLIVGPMVIVSAVAMYNIIARHDARVCAVGMIAGGAWLTIAGGTFTRKRWRWVGLSAGVLTLPFFPIGTILGAATIAVLCRRGVAELYHTRRS
jgi:hypothetical protein